MKKIMTTIRCVPVHSCQAGPSWPWHQPSSFATGRGWWCLSEHTHICTQFPPATEWTTMTMKLIVLGHQSNDTFITRTALHLSPLADDKKKRHQSIQCSERGDGHRRPQRKSELQVHRVIDINTKWHFRQISMSEYYCYKMTWKTIFSQWKKNNKKEKKKPRSFSFCLCHCLIKYPDLSLYLNLSSIGVTSLHDGDGEMSHEVRQGAQLAWKHKVKQGPQLLQIVLDGRTWQYQSVGCAEL
jgi:hypothetical protein